MPPDAIRECALALLRRAIMPLTGCGSVLVAEIDILLAEAKRTSAEKQQLPPTIDRLSEHEGLGPYMKVVAALNSLIDRQRELEKQTRDENMRLMLRVQDLERHLVKSEHKE